MPGRNETTQQLFAVCKGGKFLVAHYYIPHSTKRGVTWSEDLNLAHLYSRKQDINKIMEMDRSGEFENEQPGTFTLVLVEVTRRVSNGNVHTFK